MLEYVVDRLRKITLTNMSILLTGGAGFIGSHVAEFLLERGERVVVVDEVNDYYDVEIKYDNIR